MYYEPKEYDLEIVLGLDEPNMSYEFNMFVIWQHKDGRLFYGIDSGCSCPCPFEDVHGLDQLTAITKHGFDSFVSELKAWAKYYDGKPFLPSSEIQKAVDVVSDRLGAL